MTVLLEHDCEESDILDFVRSWIDRLSTEDYQGALDMTYVSEHSQWTAQRLQSMIINYGFEEGIPENQQQRVTDLNQAEAAKDAPWYIAAVYRATDDDWAGAEVEYGLPLNGAESDLNAHFEVVSLPEGLALELLDLRVD